MQKRPSVCPAIGPDTKIQVTGNVVDNSFEIGQNKLTFDIYDPTADPTGASLLHVRYDGGVSATFGNEVTAICTGKKDASGMLVCSELVTKCPSKYESAEGSLSISDLIAYGDTVIDKPVKMHGTVKAGTISSVGAAERFIVHDAETGQELRVIFEAVARLHGLVPVAFERLHLGLAARRALLQFLNLTQEILLEVMEQTQRAQVSAQQPKEG